MQNMNTQQYDVLKEYDGKYCRVFLGNSTCLTGWVTLADGWIVIQHPNRKQCTVQLEYVISISEFVPRDN